MKTPKGLTGGDFSNMWKESGASFDRIGTNGGETAWEVATLLEHSISDYTPPPLYIAANTSDEANRHRMIAARTKKRRVRKKHLKAIWSTPPTEVIKLENWKFNYEFQEGNGDTFHFSGEITGDIERP